MPTSIVPLSLWDKVTLHFLGVQWLIAIGVDLAPLYPRNFLTRIPHAIGDFYVRTYNDPLAQGLSTPGEWYHSFVWLEILVQVPLSLWLASRYLHRLHHEPATLVGLLFYGVQVANNTYACLYEMFSFDDALVSRSQKFALASFFAPYIILPASFVLTAARRIVCNARAQDRQARRLANLARAGAQKLTFVVTGANSGIGFGILEQLIDQLDVALSEGAVRLRLIPTVRSEAKADDVRKRLAPRLKRYGRAVELDFVHLDLCDMASIKRGCADLSTKGQIDGLICNAGMADFDHLSLKVAFQQAVSQGIMAVLTVPEYIIQKLGSRTADGMSKTFQVNFFGHYIMVELLKDTCPNFVWMTSLEAAHDRLDPADVQAMGHRFGYQSSKQLINVMYARQVLLQRHESIAKTERGAAGLRLVHPGFCAPNIVAAILPSFFLPAWEGMFHVLSVFGYRHHVASAYNGAFAAAEAALDLACGVSTVDDSISASNGNAAKLNKLGAETHSFGSAISPLGWSYSLDEGALDIDTTEPRLAGVVAEVESLKEVWLKKLSKI